MKEKKDGRYFNFFSDANLLTAFEDVSYLLGKTKTRLMEEAMADSILSYVQTAKDLSQIHEDFCSIEMIRRMTKPQM